VPFKVPIRDPKLEVSEAMFSLMQAAAATAAAGLEKEGVAFPTV